jgi:phosphate transport system substrate-binding protein
MSQNPNRRRPLRCGVLLALMAALLLSACKRGEGGGPSERRSRKTTIQNIGSDTMVNLAQAWAEEYAKVDPSISVEVSGGGSGIGIAALINRTADLANASRRLEPEELAQAKRVGEDPKEYIVGYDALSIYVHKTNPLAAISMEELGEIYREGGKLSKWSELGVAIPGLQEDRIIRVSRQNNSGTYHYFREAVLGKDRDFRAGSLDMNGSKDVVELVSKTPGAIGYSGMGYATPEVKVLRVSRKKGEPAVAPSIASTLDKTYPITRPMFMYTPGEPGPHVKKYIDWVMSDAGQRIVENTGYVPLPKR